MSFKKSFLIETKSEKIDSIYTTKIKTPVYIPRDIAPSAYGLINKEKYKELIEKIEASSVSPAEKEFLKDAATRHLGFNYELVADYYAGATKEMQELMEQSALVIIDFDKAFGNGFINLVDEIADQYKETYTDEG